MCLSQILDECNFLKKFLRGFVNYKLMMSHYKLPNHNALWWHGSYGLHHVCRGYHITNHLQSIRAICSLQNCYLHHVHHNNPSTFFHFHFIHTLPSTCVHHYLKNVCYGHGMWSFLVGGQSFHQMRINNNFGGT